jgi:hypothetical protein
MIDPSTARLSLTLTIPPPLAADGGAVALPAAPSRGGRKGRAAGRPKVVHPTEVHLELGQDMRRLKGAGGDTASVVWRTGIHLLEHVLPHLLHPTAPSSVEPLLSAEHLRQADVLELGSGTGALAVVLAPFCRRWTASDLPEALRLIEANLKLNGLDPTLAVDIQELDWTTYLASSPDRPRPLADLASLPDLIVATDVLYHPSLIEPLLATLNFYSEPLRTTTLFVAEFRTEDVIRDWLTAWLADDGGWEIRRLPNGSGVGGWGDGGRFVGWVAWRR